MLDENKGGFKIRHAKKLGVGRPRVQHVRLRGKTRG